MAAEHSLIGSHLGRFRIDAFLGAGGMGAVYRASDTALGRTVAVKVLPPHLVGDESRLRRFVQEARAASSLNHPNIVTIHEIGSDSGQHFIAMELVDGETLRERMARRVDAKKLAEIGAQIAEGLAVAHAAGIVHRDLKPENIMLSASGYAKILDFGLAKLRDPDTALDGQTMVKNTTPNAVLGTPSYMSPEQASGGEVDHRSDIFALGCILYEMASGQQAFTGSSVVDTLHKIINDDPAPLRDRAPNVPPELQRIIRKCLVKEPDARYQSAKDLAIDLRDFRRDVDSDSGFTAAGPRQRPRSLTIPLIAIAAAALVVAGYFVLRRRSAAPPAAEKQARITRVTSSGKVIAAAISPDGKYIAYAYSDAGQQGLWLRQVTTGSSLQLVAPARVGMWGHTFSPDGNSIYYSVKEFGPIGAAGTVYEIPTIGGQPRRRVSGVDSSVGFSPDGKRIAFIRNHYPTAAESALVIANADGSGERMLLAKKAPESLSAGFFVGTSWSPDGRFIAITNRLNAMSSKPLAIDAQTGAEKPLSNDRWVNLGQIAWAPDGRRLLLIGAPDKGTQAQVWSLSYPEGQRRQITNDLFTYRNVSLTADGKSLAAVAADNDQAIWLTPLSGDARPKRLTSAKYDGINGMAPAPDGSIVFTTLENGNVDLWSIDANGENRRQLTATDGPEMYPEVSADGRTVFFNGLRDDGWGVRRINRDGSDEKKLCAISRPSTLSPSPDGRWVVFSQEANGTETLWKVAVDGGQPVRVTEYEATSPRLSPDGKRVAFFRIGSSDVFIAPSDGGPPTGRFTANPTTYFTFAWTADGTGILHNGWQNDRNNIWLQPLKGGEPRRVTHFDEQYILHFDRSRTGDALIVVRGTLTRDAVLITGF